jgi:hypothetical protein
MEQKKSALEDWNTFVRESLILGGAILVWLVIALTVYYVFFWDYRFTYTY